MGDPIRGATSPQHCRADHFVDTEHPVDGPEDELGLHHDVIVDGGSEQEIETLTKVAGTMDGVEIIADQVAWYTEAGAEAALATGVAEAVSTVLAPVGILIALYEMGHAIYGADDAGTRDGLLGAAFGGDGSGSPGWALGISSALMDAPPSELAATRGSLTAAIDRSRFDDALDVAARGRREHPDAFAEAAASFRQAHRAYTDGLAAGIEGWTDASRGEVFQRGVREGQHQLRVGGNSLRAAARADKIEGFADAMTGAVDRRREIIDPHYRSGVHHFERTRASGGDDAVRREWDRLDTSRCVPTRASSGAPLRG